MEIENGNQNLVKKPLNRPKNFLEYAKMKAGKKFISTLFRTINRYRARHFQGIQKLIILQTFLKTLSKYLNPPIKQQIFWLLKHKESDLPYIQSSTAEIINTLSSVISNSRLRKLSASFFSILYYKKKPTFSEPSTDIDKIVAFYYGQVNRTLLKFEKKMKNREEIWKDRAYMKILAYARWLKYLSPYPSRNSSPSKSNSNSPNPSPLKSSALACPYSPEKYKPIPKFNRSHPIYYPLYKLFTFLDQNKFMVRAKSFKLWKFQYLAESLVV